MVTSDLPPLSPQNQDSLRSLMRAIAGSRGMFSLILVRCNYRALRDRISTVLKQQLTTPLHEVNLVPQTQTLFTSIRKGLGDEQPAAILVNGLETVENLTDLLRVTNQSREEFRNNLPCPLAIWITDSIFQRLIREATDFESWASITIVFESEPAELTQFILKITDEVFSRLLSTRENVFLNSQALNLDDNSPLRGELRAACEELHRTQSSLPLELQASVQFILGRVTDNTQDKARQHYEKSLDLWHQAHNLERCGHVQFYLGLWWANQALRYLGQRPELLKQAQAYLEAAITTFEQIHRSDLVAKFINYLGEVLHRQQNWVALDELAHKAFLLHQRYDDLFRQAKALGLMAEVAIAKPNWSQAESLASQALACWQNAAVTLMVKPGDNTALLKWERSFHRPWYLFSLGKAQRNLGRAKEAIQALEDARNTAKASYDPDLYTQILDELRAVYFDQKRYLEAYKTRQARREIQSKFSLRAFIGPGRLQDSQEIANPALPAVEPGNQIAPEILSSGRQQALEDLLHRAERKDYRLTVLYGPSGVGKSSMLQAGLIPALKQQPFDGRRVIPVLQQIYTDWIENLGIGLAEAGREANVSELDQPPKTVEDILQQLRDTQKENFKTVLIFDQFEEFFFANLDFASRQVFYDFAVECFKILDLEIILSMREDYLHYLLICNRFSGLEIIGNNILDKSILYYIGNFTKADTYAIIQDRTEKTQFKLDADLIDQLVRDLAGDFNEIRPIELQIVGAQLQSDDIRTLAQYRGLADQGHPPKEILVNRYLESVVQDCGPENREVAEVILYLLTSEDGTRPIKTKSELMQEKLYVAIQQNIDKLDLILEIFVRSGIVLLLPSSPTDSYQLVHDYLVSMVRQRVEHGRINDLQKRLNEQKGQIRRLGMILSWVAIAASLLGVLSTRNWMLSRILEVERDSISALQKADGYTIESLLLALKTGRSAQKIWWIDRFSSDSLLTLQSILDSAYERNFFYTDQQAVNWVSYSEKYRVIATAGKDGTLKFWDFQGKSCEDASAQCGVLGEHYPQFLEQLNALRLSKDQEQVFRVDFDDQHDQLTFAFDRGQTYVWKISKGTLRSLEAYADSRDENRYFTRSIFTPDGQGIVTASFDDQIRVWDANRLEETPLTAWSAKTGLGTTEGVAGMRFSPSGKMLITQDFNGLVRFWNWRGMRQQPTERVEAIYNQGGGTYGIAVSPKGQQTPETRGQLEGKYVITTGNQGNFRIWQLSQDGRSYFLKQELSQQHTKIVSAVEFNKAGNLLATADEVGLIKVWKFDQGEVSLVATLKGHQDWIWNLKFLEEGQALRLLSSSADGTVRIWDLAKASKGPENQLAHWQGLNLPLSAPGQVRNPGVLWSAQFDPRAITEGENPLLVTAGDDGYLSLWQVPGSSQKNPSANPPQEDPPQEIVRQQVVRPEAASPNVKPSLFWATFADPSESTGRDGQRPAPQGHRTHTLLTTDYQGFVRVWQLDGKTLAEKGFIQHGSGSVAVQAVSYDPNQHLVASADVQGEIKLSRLSQEGTLLELKAFSASAFPLRSVTFRPDGEYLAAASDDGKVYLWKTEDLLRGHVAPAKTIAAHRGGVAWVSFSPNSRWLVSGGRDGSVIVWRASGQEEIAKLTGHSQRVTWVGFDATGQYLATASKDGSVIVWSTKWDLGLSLRQTVQFRIRYRFSGHENGAFSASFTPDRTQLAVSQGNGEIKIWRLESLQELIDRGCEWLKSDYLPTHRQDSRDIQNLATYCQKEVRTTSHTP